MRISSSYENSLPPENLENIGTPNYIFPFIEILSVDIVDTVDMVVGLTMMMKLKWKDYDVNFENIKTSRSEEKAIQRIPVKDGRKLWLPHKYIVHENAILGEIKKEKAYILEVEVTEKAKTMNPEESRETQIYQGKDSWLILSQRIKSKYICKFSLANFPFDKSSCEFIITLDMTENNSIRLMDEIDSVVYHGPKILNEFKIFKLGSNTQISHKKTSYIFTIFFERLYMQYLLTTFFQSFLLLVLAYLTLFIDHADFSNRFMGALTCLLVLVSLLSTISEDIPKTAYYKYVDIWFNWFILNIFTIILLHVLVDYLHKNFHRVLPINVAEYNHLKTQNMRTKSQYLNTICKLIIPICNIFFITIYFYISIYVY